MPHIIVDDEQARLIREVKATESIEIRDRNGELLGYVNVTHGWTQEDIAMAKQARDSDEPRYTTSEVLEHLKSLEEE